MNDTVKTALIATGVFAVIVAANLTTQAFYTRTSVTSDKITGLAAIAGGIIITSILIKKLK